MGKVLGKNKIPTIREAAEAARGVMLFSSEYKNPYQKYEKEVLILLIAALEHMTREDVCKGIREAAKANAAKFR